jgi:hypothetical protein
VALREKKGGGSDYPRQDNQDNSHENHDIDIGDEIRKKAKTDAGDQWESRLLLFAIDKVAHAYRSKEDRENQCGSKIHGCTPAGVLWLLPELVSVFFSVS